MGSSGADSTVFLTLVDNAGERESARLLIDSIRSFGGHLSRAPILLFESDPQVTSCAARAAPEVRILPLAKPQSPPGYWFADKVGACARAEELVGPDVRSLVWFNPECLVLRPPRLLDLSSSFDVALRPVHIRNVGLPVEEPVDEFWRRVYAEVGITDTAMVVESFVDARRIRAYFNTHVVAVNPKQGLFRRWRECFKTLLEDQEFRSGPGRDDLHRVFLHQAVLSALIAASVKHVRIRVLPPDYSYPYNLQAQVPSDRRARALDELTCVVCEGRSLDPARMTDIEVREPLRSWLAARRRA